jgi:pectin methylesterase-like acyl-CoA thioesterase
MRRVLVLALAGVVCALASTTQAFAATHWVNDDGAALAPPGTSCERPGYSRIQAAVTAAAAGDRINVCPGTYPEQVVVESAAKSNLLIRSVVPLAARIEAPQVMEPVHGDIVRIDAGARNVTLGGFVISGPLPDTLFCAVQLRTGVRVKGGAPRTSWATT